MSQTFLIADDSAFARFFMKDVLGSINDTAKIIEANSGEDALLKASSNTIDFFLLDMNMGEPDGLQVAKDLISSGTNPSQITMITGNKSTSLVDAAKHIGINYINKVINPKDKPRFAEELCACIKGGNNNAG